LTPLATGGRITTSRERRRLFCPPRRLRAPLLLLAYVRGPVFLSLRQVRGKLLSFPSQKGSLVRIRRRLKTVASLSLLPTDEEEDPSRKKNI